MTEIMEVLREEAMENNDQKNEIYYTPKQKRVLKAIAENPKASASEVADEAEVHPSYIPYICERVSMDVVENIHRLEEYLSEREGLDSVPQDESDESDSSVDIDEVTENAAVMKSFGATPVIEDGNKAPKENQEEISFTREVPVKISIEIPASRELARIIGGTQLSEANKELVED